MHLKPALLVFAMLLVPLARPAAGQVRNAPGGGSSLFGAGQSPFGASQGGAFGRAGGGSQFGAGQFNGGGLSGGGNQGLGPQQQEGGFIGRDRQDVGALFEQLNRNGARFLNRLERTFSARNRGRDANQASDARLPIRVKLRLGFEGPAANSATGSAVAVRLNTMLAQKGFGSAVVAVEDGALVLRGEVADDADRRMLARLVRLEPGVGRVDNQLRVAGQSSSAGPELLPPGY